MRHLNRHNKGAYPRIAETTVAFRSLNHRAGARTINLRWGRVERILGAAPAHFEEHRGGRVYRGFYFPNGNANPAKFEV